MSKETYSKYVQSTNLVGSNKATSYVKAIDWLCKMLVVESFGFQDCVDIWSVQSSERIHDLYEFVLTERSKGASSAWNIEGIPVSYLRDGFCSAALKSYEDFLVESSYEKELLGVIESHDGDGLELASKLERKSNYPSEFFESLAGSEGQDAIRSVRVRLNQHVFRKAIMSIYRHTCCITGLNIPEINRASHIIPWAEDDAKRLDPSNGLCLSATYDAAFDKYLISLDNDYRLILSANIKEYYSSDSVKEYFISKEGMLITLPDKYKPNKEYLAAHREKGNF